MSATTRLQNTKPIRCRTVTLRPKRTPWVMGILNVTPDSFSDGGRFVDIDAACSHARCMVEAGADVIDIGGESTRPGADPVSVDEELTRVVPMIERLASEVDVPLSIDTRRAAVADAALRAGCHIVNDVTACRDPEMGSVVASHDAAVVLMHMKGEPQTMQEKPYYDDVVGEVKTFLFERAAFVEACGVSPDRILIDPGIGFGKRFQDNLDLLNQMSELRDPYPMVIGASRKRFLGELLDGSVGERLPGSLAVAARCYQCHVDMVRVHDVKETVDMFRVLDAMDNPDAYSADW